MTAGLRRLRHAPWLEGTTPDAPFGGRVAVTIGDPIERYVAAAEALDGEAIEEALDELFGRGSFEAIVDTWLMPAAAALGDAWETGRIDVAGEHAASAAMARRLAGAFEAAAALMAGLSSSGCHPAAGTSSGRSPSPRPSAGAGSRSCTWAPTSRSRAGSTSGGVSSPASW